MANRRTPLAQIQTLANQEVNGADCQIATAPWAWLKPTQLIGQPLEPISRLK
jgi:hypothetical protein